MPSTPDPYLQRAEAEYQTAKREYRIRKDANPAAICLHAHGCVLRYLQARLRQAELEFPSTPHPVVLLECCLELEPDWELYRSDFRTLHVNHLNAQDPEVEILPEHMEASFRACERFREVVQDTLGY